MEVQLFVQKLPVILLHSGYKTFSFSTRLTMKFILLINVKMPAILDDRLSPDEIQLFVQKLPVILLHWL